MRGKVITKVRKNNPLIHHLTNQVVMNFTANGLLSFGGSPIMAKSIKEVSDIVSIAEGVLINIGTLTTHELPSMIKAGETANKRGIPVVLDPVGVAATSFRAKAMEQILECVQPTVIKGNAGEIAYLAQIPWNTKGVESIGDGDTEEVAANIAKTYHTTAIVTGKTDIIHNGEKVIKNQTGHQILTNVTGAGCLLGSIITACLTTDDTTDEQAFAALEFYGLAAEFAAAQDIVKGPGTFLPQFIDALSIDFQKLKEG